MRVEVDHNRCLGTGFCEAIAGELFEIDVATGVASARSDAGEELRAAAVDAARACPTNAITVDGALPE